jgi:phosphopantothenoylcysteine decarboxylase/phosphopantothenate--cysteine ligase
MACGEYRAGPDGRAAGDLRGDHGGAERRGGAAAGGQARGGHGGPTAEPIDPVRLITNRSSGKQGYAIARRLAALGAR